MTQSRAASIQPALRVIVTLPSMPFKTPSSSCSEYSLGFCWGSCCSHIALHRGFPLSTLSHPHMLCAGMETSRWIQWSTTRCPGAVCCQEGPVLRGSLTKYLAAAAVWNLAFTAQTRLLSIRLHCTAYGFYSHVLLLVSCMMSKGSSLGTELRLWVHGNRPSKLSAWGTPTH